MGADNCRVRRDVSYSVLWDSGKPEDACVRSDLHNGACGVFGNPADGSQGTDTQLSGIQLDLPRSAGRVRTGI